MDVQDILIPLIKLFLMMIPGFVLSKRGNFNESGSKSLSLIVVYVTWPCLIVDSFQIPFSRTLLLNACFVLAALIIAMMLSYLLGQGIHRVAKTEKNRAYLFTFMLMFSNTGFMGIPITNALYGKEGSFYAVLMDAVCNIFIYTVGIMLIKTSIGVPAKASVRELFSPGMVGIVIAILLFITNTRLPAILSDTVASLGSATAPLAMLTLGFQLGNIRLKELVGDLNVYLLALLKLVVIPLIFIGVLSFLFEDMSLFAKVVILEISMPVAASTTIFTQRYDGDATFAAKGVLLTTVISMITIPALAVIVN